MKKFPLLKTWLLKTRLPTISLSIIGLLTSLWVAGCVTEPEVDDPTPPADVVDSCSTGRWIGISTDDECPKPPGADAGGWSSRPLFAAPDPGSSLSPFCLFEHDDPTRGGELERLVSSGELQQVDPDCAEVFVAAPMSQTLAPALEEQFLAQAGAVSLPEGGSGSVRLAVLDTSPTSEDEIPLGIYKHGATLAHLARKLLCQGGDASCAARVTTRLALPMLSINPWEIGDDGGYFGTPGQLAEAIHDEVTHWQSSPKATRLVLNLALAWNPDALAEAGGMDADVQAVYEALRDAACRGVLVVAAAGNLGSGPKAGTGPLMPAAWQSERAPSTLPGLGSCVDSAPDDEADPLLYAVAGVDSRGLRLANSRPGAEPALVAYGSHGVTSYGNDPNQWTGTYTGSSVATAVISSTAAAVWHYRPEISRSELMSLLYQSGDSFIRKASFDPDQKEPYVRRISLCRAVEKALDDQIGFCQDAGFADWSSTPPSLNYAPENLWTVHDASLMTLQPGDPPAGCPGGTYVCAPGHEPQFICPFQQEPGIDAHPWVGPQPVDIPCPSCPLIQDPDSSGLDSSCQGVQTPFTLFIEIDPAYKGGTLTDATLRIDDDYYLIDVGEEGLGVEEGLESRLEVRCIEGSSIDLLSSTADLTFYADGHGSVLNVIPISSAAKP